MIPRVALISISLIAASAVVGAQASRPGRRDGDTIRTSAIESWDLTIVDATATLTSPTAPRLPGTDALTLLGARVIASGAQQTEDTNTRVGADRVLETHRVYTKASSRTQIKSTQNEVLGLVENESPITWRPIRFVWSEDADAYLASMLDATNPASDLVSQLSVDDRASSLTLNLVSGSRELEPTVVQRALALGGDPTEISRLEVGDAYEGPLTLAIDNCLRSVLVRGDGTGTVRCSNGRRVGTSSHDANDAYVMSIDLQGEYVVEHLTSLQRELLQRKTRPYRDIHATGPKVSWSYIGSAEVGVDNDAGAIASIVMKGEVVLSIQLEGNYLGIESAPYPAVYHLELHGQHALRVESARETAERPELNR